MISSIIPLEYHKPPNLFRNELKFNQAYIYEYNTTQYSEVDEATRIREYII